MARDQDELMQLRAEVALLRAQVQEQDERRKETEADKARQASFLAWVGKTAQERTQLVADQRFPRRPGMDDLWEVELKEQPKIRLYASSEFEAIGRYAQLCGITATAHTYAATKLQQAA
jgi:hypothetical protein